MTRVLVHLQTDGTTVRVGELFTTLRRGRLSSTFSYDRSYLALRGGYPLEPALPLSTGSWPSIASLPRSFQDCAPDRWGRGLIERRVRAEATADGQTPRQLDDLDFLLGVADATRQGALRFAADDNGPFHHPSTEVPRLLRLPQLLRAAERVAGDDPDDLTAIKTLLAAGTGSLGGARPKASVLDGDDLSIAKFPHPADEWNVIAWEKTALDLAAAAGIETPTSQLLDVDGRSVLLLRRFDRSGSARIGYISAMTLVESSDGEPRDYLDVADAITTASDRTDADLAALWRRIAFSIAIGNTDDHLRNTGFLRGPAGWRLAPAFDLNPNPTVGATRVTSIAGAVGLPEEPSALLASAALFGLSDSAARGILREVLEAVAGWARTAGGHGIPRAEIARFAPAFEAASAALSR